MGRSLVSAGVIVVRGEGPARSALIIHRPHRHDWTLPKGTPKAGELLPQTAFREFEEETGARLAGLAQPLGSIGYRVEGVPKRVCWWLGRLDDDASRAPVLDPGEVDKVRWCRAETLPRRLTYADELPVVERALAATPGVPLVIVRHGKALPRKGWKGKPDADRRLGVRGVRQAEALTGLLRAYGITHVASSSSERCVATVRPYAEALGTSVETIPALSEEGAVRHPARVHTTMDRLRVRVLETGEPLVVCGHRPVLQAMVEHFGLEYPEVMKPAEALVIHLDRATGEVVATERWRSKA